MAKKISTADCKVALIAAWPEFFGDKVPTTQAGKWKRVSKYGKKGAPIDRIFHHETLPLQALVVEENGAITNTVIRGFAEFEVDMEGGDGGTEAEQKMLERAQSNEGMKFLTTIPCFRPSDFTFKMCSAEDAESEGVFYELYPKRDFGRAHWNGDAIQVDYYIQTFLPEGDGEAMEGTYTTERTIEEAIAALREKGFIPEEEFVETTRRTAGGGDDD